MIAQRLNNDDSLPLRSATEINLERFNRVTQLNQPIEDIELLFQKEVILTDHKRLNIQTLQIPGFIGIDKYEEVQDSQGNAVSGFEDIVKFLERYGLLVCVYQGNPYRYGVPLDLRLSVQEWEKGLFTQTFIKNEGLHAAALVPARRPSNRQGEEGEEIIIDSFASFDKARGDTGTEYRESLLSYYYNFLAVAQCLIFDPLVTPAQSREYINSIICWMALLQTCVEFTNNDFDGGGDPVRVADVETLKEFLQNAALASLGSTDAIDFLNRPENKNYCAEFIYICLNTPLYPFNRQGLSQLLDGDQQKADEILKLQDRHNSKRPNFLNKLSRNREFVSFHIPMPEVDETLPPLNELMTQSGQALDANSLPFPPFRLSHFLRRAFRTLLPRHQSVNDTELVEAQTKLLSSMEPIFLEQLGLKNAADDDPKIAAVRGFIAVVKEQLSQTFDSYEAFDYQIDLLMQKVDEMLIGAEGVVHFVPPRIYVDLAQNDGDDNLPKGWGFKLETVGALVRRECIEAVSSPE